MKRIIRLSTLAMVLASLTILSLMVCLALAGPKECATIQSGTLTDTKGNPLTLGYDKWGYNYQAHIFNGFYDNNLRPDPPVTEGDRLEMKWNDPWLSNKDCDGDGKLDRHYGYASYRGSGAWLTNHQWGTYEDNGAMYHWDYFVKIVAVPLDATSKNGYWYTADGIEIGPVIWGDFAILQEIYNDQGTGEHGLLYKSPVGPGLGKFKP